MTDYSQAKIYEIRCNVTNDVYYGSTVQCLNERIAQHKSKNDCSATNIIDRGNFNIKVLEEYPCNSKQELETRERWYIENNVCINRSVPGRTQQEYRQDNKEYIAQHNKKYREDNKEHLKEYFKEYQEANKEKLKEYLKEYQEANKEKLKAHKSTKVKCECGCEVARGDLAKHRRSKKHADLLTSVSSE